jgi:hypothetical protein
MKLPHWVGSLTGGNSTGRTAEPLCLTAQTGTIDLTAQDEKGSLSGLTRLIPSTRAAEVRCVVSLLLRLDALRRGSHVLPAADGIIAVRILNWDDARAAQWSASRA